MVHHFVFLVIIYKHEAEVANEERRGTSAAAALTGICFYEISSTEKRSPHTSSGAFTSEA